MANKHKQEIQEEKIAVEKHFDLVHEIFKYGIIFVPTQCVLLIIETIFNKQDTLASELLHQPPMLFFFVVTFCFHFLLIFLGYNEYLFATQINCQDKFCYRTSSNNTLRIFLKSLFLLFLILSSINSIFLLHVLVMFQPLFLFDDIDIASLQRKLFVAWLVTIYLFYFLIKLWGWYVSRSNRRIEQPTTETKEVQPRETFGKGVRNAEKK